MPTAVIGTPGWLSDSLDVPRPHVALADPDNLGGVSSPGFPLVHIGRIVGLT